MALGLAVWHLPPDAFWKLTPREIAGALRGLRPRRGQPIGFEDLRHLMSLYPDEALP